MWIGVLVGWAFFSRVPRTERWGALALMIVSVVVTPRIPGMIHPSFAGGLPGMWTRNAASDTGAKTPGWGFSSSPLVVDDLVIVAAAGRLAAYDLTKMEIPLSRLRL